MIFDGDCGMCTRLAGLVPRHLAAAAAVEPWQRLDLAAYGLDPATCAQALQYVDEQGQVYAGELAVAELLCRARWWARPFGRMLRMPGVRAVAAVVYRWVARNRQRFPGGTPACAIEKSHPDR